jgi:hypothetical protein
LSEGKKAASCFLLPPTTVISRSTGPLELGCQLLVGQGARQRRLKDGGDELVRRPVLGQLAAGAVVGVGSQPPFAGTDQHGAAGHHPGGVVVILGLGGQGTARRVLRARRQVARAVIFVDRVIAHAVGGGDEIAGVVKGGGHLADQRAGAGVELGVGDLACAVVSVIGEVTVAVRVAVITSEGP